MDKEYEWELVEPPQTHRKILRNSIIAHMSPAYPGMFEPSSNTLQSKIFSSIPAHGVTCSELNRLLGLSHSIIYTTLYALIRKKEVVSVRINGRATRYYRTEDIPSVLMLPYRPQRF